MSIVIVNWNVKDLLRKCLRSIEQTKGKLAVEILVVDNKSHDGSVAMVEREFPSVRCMALTGNTGFAAANNRAARVAQGRYIFILNPDTEVLPHSLEDMVGYMDAHPDIALLGPQIVNVDGSFQKGSVRRDPGLASQLLILLKLQHVFSRSRVMRRYYFEDFNIDQKQQVDQIMGAAMFFRASDLRDMKYFDEGYFLWFEEVDLCLRLRKAGKNIVYVPDTKIVHHGGASFRQRLPIAKQLIYDHSTLRFFYKNYGIIYAFVVLCVMPINLVLVLLYQLVTSYGKK